MDVKINIDEIKKLIKKKYNIDNIKFREVYSDYGGTSSKECFECGGYVKGTKNV